MFIPGVRGRKPNPNGKTSALRNYAETKARAEQLLAEAKEKNDANKAKSALAILKLAKAEALNARISHKNKPYVKALAKNLDGVMATVRVLFGIKK